MTARTPANPSGKCRLCGMPLKGEESIRRGYGDKCWRKFSRMQREAKEEPLQEPQEAPQEDLRGRALILAGIKLAAALEDMTGKKTGKVEDLINQALILYPDLEEELRPSISFDSHEIEDPANLEDQEREEGGRRALAMCISIMDDLPTFKEVYPEIATELEEAEALADRMAQEREEADQEAQEEPQEGPRFATYIVDEATTEPGQEIPPEDLGPAGLPKPEIELTGQDGNVFNLLGICTRAARKSGWPSEQIKSFLEEATGGDYDHALQTIMKYFNC